MSKYFAGIYDMAMSPLEKGKFKEIRENLLSQADGRVLEIGAGTGINFPLYKNCVQVDAIEPSVEMIEKSELRRKLSTVPITVHLQSAETLTFSENTFDTVIATLVFCTIPDPEQALREIQRVCKPGGRVLFFEHVKMKQPVLATLQEVLNPFWKKICDGCQLNRNTSQLIQNSGLHITKEESYYKGLFVVLECVLGHEH